MAKHWLVKQEPTAYSWQQLVADRGTVWSGVRNSQARLHLRAMEVGDQVLFYHSVVDKAVVGVARITRAAFPDPLDERWSAVELVPVAPVEPAVTLATIKQDPGLQSIPLLRQPRLSVVPLTREEFASILNLAATPARSG